MIYIYIIYISYIYIIYISYVYIYHIYISYIRIYHIYITYIYDIYIYHIYISLYYISIYHNISQYDNDSNDSYLFSVSETLFLAFNSDRAASSSSTVAFITFGLALGIAVKFRHHICHISNMAGKHAEARSWFCFAELGSRHLPKLRFSACETIKFLVSDESPAETVLSLGYFPTLCLPTAPCFYRIFKFGIKRGFSYLFKFLA